MSSSDQSGSRIHKKRLSASAQATAWLGHFTKSTLGVVVIFTGLSWLGLTFGVYIAHSNAIWIANGALLGILLHTRRKKWAGYLIATGIACTLLHLLTHLPLGRSVIYAIANIAEVYPAALFLCWGNDRRPDLSRPKVLLRFLIATVCAPLFSAVIVELGSHITTYGAKFDGSHSWYYADVLGIAIMTPLVLAFRIKHLQYLLQEKFAETIWTWIGTLAIAFFVCRQSSYPIYYCFFPIMLWVVFRLGLTGSAVSILLISLPADYFTVLNRGPFAMVSAYSHIDGIHELQLYLATLVMTVYVVSSALAENERLRKDLAKSHQKTEMLARTDALTGLPNRRIFDERLEAEWKRSIREKTQLSLLMIDADHFKAFNDCYGHPAGDRLLRKLARVMVEFPRRSMDLVCRYGGEEFSILLPSTDADGALLFAEKLRARIARIRQEDEDGDLPGITVSIGISTLDPAHPGEYFDELLQSADRALYDAKEAGRNTVKIRPLTTPQEEITT